MQSLRLHTVAGAASILLLSACAVSRPPVTSAPLRAAAMPTAVKLDAGGDIAGKLGQALAPRLAARGIRIDSAAPQTLTLAVSEHAASMGVTIAGNEAISTPRKHHWYHRCDARRLSAALMLREADAQQPQALVRGSVDACKIDDAAIDALAGALVKAL